MPINDIAHGLRRVGKLRMGVEVETSNGKTRPEKLDTWRFTSPDEHVIRAVAAHPELGGEARPWDNDGSPEWETITNTSTLDVLITPEADAFSQWYEMWKAGGCQRRCDGDTETLSGKPCMCPADRDERADLSKQGKACKATTRLSVVLPMVPALGSWMVESHGYYAAKELASTIALLDMAGARRGLLPARLRIEQRQVKRDGKTQKFGVPVIDVAVTLEGLFGGELLPAGVDPSTGEIGPNTAGELPAAAPVTSTKQANERKSTIADRSRVVKANDPMPEPVLAGFVARIELLDPEQNGLLRAALAAKGLDWGAKRLASETATVEQCLTEVEKVQAGLWEDRRKRVFAALDEFDPTMRQNADIRHQFISDATGGATSSTKTMTEAQASAVIKATGSAAAEPLRGTLS